MIAVISDSHIPTRASDIPDKFEEIMEDADLIVHCGDFETREVFENLKEFGEIVGVKGNCDRFEIQNSTTFECQENVFGVYHGTGITPRGHLPTLVNVAEKLDADILFTGHTHQQRAVEKDGKIVLNPGSCTGVGGATAASGNPKMMTVDTGECLNVEMIELSGDGNLLYKEKKFDL